MAHFMMDFALHLMIIIIIRHKLGFNKWVDNIIMDLQQVGYGGMYGHGTCKVESTDMEHVKLNVRTWNM